MRTLLFLLLSLPLHATVFQAQSIDEGIKEADGIIIGHYLSKKSIELEDGRIATQMIFKMNKEIGMQSDLLGMDEIIVHYPGGTIGDKTVKIEGNPEFLPGESIALFIKSDRDRYWGLNLGMGAFKIINYGNDRMIVNTVFPDDRRLSHIRTEEFEKKIKAIKGSSFRVVVTPLYPTELDNRKPASVSAGKNRAVASKIEEGENSESANGMNPMWLVFFLATIGGLFRFSRQKEAK